MASKPHSPWVKPSMGIPGHLAEHNTLSSTALDLDVTGEWIPKQVLRKRGGQGSRGHLTSLSVQPGTCSSDAHGHFLQGHTVSLEPAFDPAQRTNGK